MPNTARDFFVVGLRNAHHASREEKKVA
jgi:hypothetical protein